MVAFGHTSAGVAVGLLAYQIEPNNLPLGLGLAVGLGIVSHYLLDGIPHGHFSDFKSKWLWLDIALNLILFFLIVIYISYLKFGLSLQFFYILFGIGGAQLPDINHAIGYFLHKRGFFKIENNFHEGMHWFQRKNNTRKWSITDLWQIIFSVLCVVFLLKS